jgi:hypothetical protein
MKIKLDAEDLMKLVDTSIGMPEIMDNMASTSLVDMLMSGASNWNDTPAPSAAGATSPGGPIASQPTTTDTVGMFNMLNSTISRLDSTIKNLDRATGSTSR